METLRISAIVPCYNAARYLEEALRSACDQQPRPIEVIVVDDGSTDESLAIAGRLGPPVMCVHQDHRGISHARNRGLEIARGDVIAFLDADDVWTASSLAARAQVLDSDPSVDCVTGLVQQFISPELPDEVRARLVCPEEASAARVAGSMLIRRRAFDRIGVFDPTFQVGETIDWVARADAGGVVMRTIDTIVLRRRLHDDNTGVRNAHLRPEYLRVLKASLDRRRASPPPAPAPPSTSSSPASGR
jgi:glycosyltransferase involved in cell wall biosynthesis